MSRQTILDIAANEKGVTENPAASNVTQYGSWYGFNGVPWCAIFVSWVYDKAGYPLGRIDSEKGFHYCPSAYNFWKRRNRLTNDPKPGDIVLFDWNGDGKSDHTGIFIEWIEKGKVFTSWEGNTSFSSQSDGGQVMMRKRITSTVKAFVNPGIFDEAKDLYPSNLKRGDESADVAHVQKMLYELQYPIIVDGKFGPITEQIVRQFQNRHGIAETGIVDEITGGVLEAELSNRKIDRRKLQTGSFLTKGDSGALVVLIQKALNKNGALPPIAEDGVFGAKTVAAVKQFQKKAAIDIDGIVGPKTFEALGI